MYTREAIEQAAEVGLDLVEVGDWLVRSDPEPAELIPEGLRCCRPGCRDK